MSRKGFEKVYGCIAELWCSPQDVDMQRSRREAREVATALKDLHAEVETSLARFLQEDPVGEEEYIGLFELEPRCPLYLGSHGFDEPMTCAHAAVSDRNEYMIELAAIYRHFGFEPKGELPDYLPMMVEFLTLVPAEPDEWLRTKFIREYMLPFLPPMRSKLEGLGSPYLHLLGALQGILSLDLSTEGIEARHD